MCRAEVIKLIILQNSAIHSFYACGIEQFLKMLWNTSRQARVNSYFAIQTLLTVQNLQIIETIRERLVLALRLTISSFANQEPICFYRYFKNIYTVPIRFVVPIIHSCSIKSLVCKINFKELLPANLRCVCAD